jgi:hypothetical protein
MCCVCARVRLKQTAKEGKLYVAFLAHSTVKYRSWCIMRIYILYVCIYIYIYSEAKYDRRELVRCILSTQRFKALAAMDAACIHAFV